MSDVRKALEEAQAVLGMVDWMLEEGTLSAAETVRLDALAALTSIRAALSAPAPGFAAGVEAAAKVVREWPDGLPTRSNLLAALDALSTPSSPWCHDMSKAPRDGTDVWLAVKGRSVPLRGCWIKDSFIHNRDAWVVDGGAAVEPYAFAPCVVPALPAREGE